MAANTLDIVVSDDKLEIAFTLRDSNGAAIDITGFTIRFAIRKEDATTNTNDANNTCTLTAPTLGRFKYTFEDTDIPTQGTYRGQIHITFTDGRTHVVPRFVRLNGLETFIT